MTQAMTKHERAQRQRTMILLRNWMETHGVSRQEVADVMGITLGHFSTLINANRTASQAQVNIATALVQGSPIEATVERPKSTTRVAQKQLRAKNSTAKKVEPNKLRPMNKFETEFVVTVAKAWIENNLTADQDDLVKVVRALSIGIRS